MINLENEKSLALDAQERYDIIGFAMDAADDNGFINSFVFERALYCFAAIVLYPEHKDKIVSHMQNSPIEGWKFLINDGLIEQMQKDHESTLNQLANEAKIWFDEYADWAHSARGVLSIVQQFSGNMVENAAASLTGAARESGVSQLLEVAEDWGMTRNALKDQPQQEVAEDEESLFK